MLRVLKHIIIYLLVPVSFASAQEDIILRINSKPIYKSEFIHYYRRAKSTSAEKYLPRFIDYELMLAEAKSLKLDTLTSFNLQLKYYESLFGQSRWNDAILNNSMKATWVKIEHIDKNISQKASSVEQRSAVNLMDSLYLLLRNGASFDDLAAKYSDDYHVNPSSLSDSYIKLSLLPNEIINKINYSNPGELIAPFYSPSGIHIIRLIAKKDSLENSNELLKTTILNDVDKMYLKNDLLVSVYQNSFLQDTVDVDQKSLEHFYKKNISDYYYEEPKFKGALVMSKSKDISSALRKYLKKYSYDDIESKFEELTKSDKSDFSKIEVGIFGLGKNLYVDKAVFKKKISKDALSEYPYFFVIGKKLNKKPDSYKDVIDRLTIDYLKNKEISNIYTLKDKYRVEINRDVLKTVNNSGSN